MSKPVIIGVAVVAVVALGGGAFFLTQDDDTSNNETSQTQTDQANTEEEHAQGTFASITATGEPQQCDVSYEGEAGSGSGTIYSDGTGRGRMQLQFTTAEGNTGSSNTLVTADKAYAWFAGSEGAAIGFVYDKATFNTGTADTQANANGPSADQNFDMHCQDWNVDEALLTPPTDVTFTSISVTQ